MLKEDLLLNSSSGTEKYYTVKFLPVSKINNNKGEIKTYYFHLDKSPPAEPVLIGLKESYYSDRTVIEAEKGGKDNILYYSYSLDKENLKPPFKGLSTTGRNIVIPLDKKIRKKYWLKIGIEDPAGNRTESDKIFSFYIDNRDYRKIDFSRLSESSLSRNNIIIKKPGDDFIYRYEISNRKDTLRNVDFMSDVLDENLTFAAADGEEKKYYFAVKSFFDEYDRTGSDEEIFSIQTDRKKPELPGITVSETNMITLTGEGDLFYSISSEKTKNKKEEYRPYAYPFLLNSYIPPGRYNISVYSRDRAGNASEKVNDSFYISKNILFVSGKNGNDKNSGTLPENPLKTLQKAYSGYFNNKIDTIMVLDGNYNLSDPLLVSKPLMIIGTGGKSVFYDKIKESEYIFTVSDSSLIIKGISFKSEKFRKNCFDSENSVIVLDNSDFSFNCSNFINQRNSTTIIEESSVTLKSRLNSVAFNNYNSTLKIDECNIDIYSDSDITGFKLFKSSCYLTDSSFSFKSSRSLYSFNLENSLLNMKNIRIKNISKESSHTVISEKSRINISDSFFSDSEGAAESLHFTLNKSKLDVKGSSLTLNSRNKSSLIKSRGSENKFSDSLLISGTPENSSSLISSEDDLYYLLDCDISLKNTINGGIIKSEDSIFEIYTSEFTNNSTENKTFMDIKGKSSIILSDNVFKGPGTVLESSEQSSVLNKNSILLEE
jgi:hypothetical protein